MEESEDPEPSTSKRVHLQEKKKVLPSKSTWSSNKQHVWKLPSIEKPCEPLTIDFLKKTVASPLDAFKCFFTDQLVNRIVTHSNLYACQKGEHHENISSEEIYTVLGIMLLSGYHKLPNKRMCWQEDPNCNVTIVSEAMRRRRFEEILRYIHLNDNTNIDTDSFYKVRPLFDYLNESFKQVPCEGSLSIDESIIPYYGRHHKKQFIRGKPISFGFEMWVIAKTNGYIMHVEPYRGSNTKLPDTGLGQGGDVVIGLVDHCNVPNGRKLYFDNLFTSVSLLEELCKKELGETGTLRENRIGKAMNLPPKKEFKKVERGKFVTVGNGKLIAVSWNDNSVVTVLSNCNEVNPLRSIQRYSRTEKKR
nr:piggyBac transposable element-derived protein 3-like [Leptinotarsa decemlineata]